jgi:hypothetical protein
MKGFYYLLIPRALFLVFVLSSCHSRVVNHFDFDSFYTTKRQGDSLVVKFHLKTDSVFLYYYFTFKNGNYLNYPLDSLDYAGVFVIDSIKKRQITLPVKDYRQYWNDSSRIYDVSLSFLSDTTFHWYIDSVRYGILDFLPHDVIFKKELGFSSR